LNAESLYGSCYIHGKRAKGEEIVSMKKCVVANEKRGNL